MEGDSGACVVFYFFSRHVGVGSKWGLVEELMIWKMVEKRFEW